MSTTLTTTLALDLIAYERAPRLTYSTGSPSLINRWVVCADGFTASVQASENHYASDTAGQSPYWGAEVTYPFVTFEIGAPSEDPGEALAEWESGGVWAWVPREAVANLLDSHGGVVAWRDRNPEDDQ